MLREYGIIPILRKERTMPTDIYFEKSKTSAEKSNLGDTRVTYKYFTRKQSLMFGGPLLAEIIRERNLVEKIKKGEITIRLLKDGSPISPHQVVMTVSGKFSDVVELETEFLSILSLCGTAYKMSQITKIVPDMPVFDFSARHYPSSLTKYIAAAAKIGGAYGTSTKEGADFAAKYPYPDPITFPKFAETPVGTCPHALSAIAANMSGNFISAKGLPRDLIHYPEISAALLTKEAYPEEPFVVLIDFTGKELDVVLRSLQLFRDDELFWGFRLDTCGERIAQGCSPNVPFGAPSHKAEEVFGVTPTLCKKVREVMDRCGCKDKKIMVSSGFGPEKVERFLAEKAPFDSIGTGSFVDFISFTADIVRVDGKIVVKAGREWLAESTLHSSAIDMLDVRFLKSSPMPFRMS